MSATEPLASRIGRTVAGLSFDHLPAEAVAKVKLCLLDLVGCAFEARDLPWSRQAVQLAIPVASGGATVIGASHAASPTDAAFANGVMAHGLVREDMHAGAISHLGMVVLPTLLALSQSRQVGGRDFITAAVAGYEVGAQIGRAVMDAELARVFRPTGITGPSGAAAAGARLLRLSPDATTSAIALAANTLVGFNQWAHTGGSEMFFHAGFAARNAVTAVRLAELGAFASPSALDGESGLFATLGKRGAEAKVTLFAAEPEILSVYHKPVPACNFAQTSCQAALRIARENTVIPDRITAITIRVPRASALYPGCDSRGPFANVLQAKMSIQYNVAAALLLSEVSEKNFTLLQDARLQRLLALTELQADDAMTQAYPGKQGGEVQVREAGGAIWSVRLEDVVKATADDVQTRFRAAAQSVVGATRAAEIEDSIEGLERSTDAGALARLLHA